jgi:hypothetical protein
MVSLNALIAINWFLVEEIHDGWWIALAQSLIALSGGFAARVLMCRGPNGRAAIAEVGTSPLSERGVKSEMEVSTALDRVGSCTDHE